MFEDMRHSFEPPSVFGKSYIGSVFALIGHLVGTFFIFMVFLGLTWGLSYGVKKLNEINPFPENILSAIQRIEVGIFWFDVLMCFILVISGAVTFVRDIRR